MGTGPYRADLDPGPSAFAESSAKERRKIVGPRARPLRSPAYCARGDVDDKLGADGPSSCCGSFFLRCKTNLLLHDAGVCEHPAVVAETWPGYFARQLIRARRLLSSRKTSPLQSFVGWRHDFSMDKGRSKLMTYAKTGRINRGVRRHDIVFRPVLATYSSDRLHIEYLP